MSRAVLGLAIAKLLVQLTGIRQYGYFRDELYYLASTRHLDFGYVEHPPLSIVILALQRALFGDSLVALRVLPALAGSAQIVAAAWLARLVGGGRTAQFLAALAALVAPEYLGTDHVYSMNSWDQLVWPLAAGVLVLALQDERLRWWILLGVVLGLGLENKISVLWLGFGLLVGLVLTPHRKTLRTRGPIVAAAIAAALFLPYVVWQASFGWPLLEFMHNATSQKMVRVGPGAFVANQILVMNPAAAPLWIAGLAGGLAARALRPWRLLAIAWLAVFALLVASGTSRANYLAPAYPMVYALGATWLEPVLRRRRALCTVWYVSMLATGALLLPFAIPVLPPDTFLRYQKRLGVKPPAEERSARAALPQHYADMFGWDELAAKVARAYRALPPEDRARCGIFGQNYGEAGAIDLLGRRLGTPGAVSSHNSYWLWGPGTLTGDVMIVIGSNPEDNGRVFESVVPVDTLRCERCMPYERDLPIFVCRRPRFSLGALWPRLKTYI